MDAFPAITGGNDVLPTVAAQLTVAELARSLRVCKAWLSILDGTPHLWRALSAKTWADKAYVPESLRAMAECPLEAKVVRESIEYNLGVIDGVAKKLHVDRRVRVHGLVKNQQYNGHCGRVLSHDGPCWQVLCDAEDGGQQRLLLLRQENVTLL
jgi:hypothetical protein